MSSSGRNHKVDHQMPQPEITITAFCNTNAAFDGSSDDVHGG